MNVKPKRAPIRVHVNGPQLRRNVRTGERHPVVIVKHSQGTTYARRVNILDREGHVVGAVIESLDRPMPGCSARVWVEAYEGVQLVEPSASPGCPLRVG